MKSPSVAPIATAAASAAGSVRTGHTSSGSRSTVDGYKLRSRLLRRLGIAPSMEGTAAYYRPPTTVVRKVAPFSEPLKYEDSEGRESKNSPAEESGITQKQAKKSSSVVTFEDQVSVIPIPKHQEYSQRIRSRLWCNKRELRIMAARNTVEYEAEGWDWRTVTEDDAFIVTASGERIHPVHLRRLFSSTLMRQPLRILQQQQQMTLYRQQQQQQQQVKSVDVPEVEKKVACCPESMSGAALEDLARQ